jgi:hypothetical protein
VWRWVEHPLGGYSAAAEISADGRFEFQVAKNSTWVSLFAGPYYQPCAVGFSPKGTSTADVSLVVDPQQLGAHLPPALMARTPTLSGMVYEQTPNGKRPIAGALVGLDGFGGDGVVIADTLTDADGRYMFCGVPQREKTTLFVEVGGFEDRSFYFEEFEGRTTFDIEMAPSSH